MTVDNSAYRIEPRLPAVEDYLKLRREAGLSPFSREAAERGYDVVATGHNLDDEAAKASVFGALSASGWHTCSMAMRLMVTNFLHETSSLGSPGLENIKWLKPVYPGDTLRLQSTLLETKPMGKRPDVGMTRNLWEMFNQHGDKVLHMDGWGMFRRRAPAA